MFILTSALVDVSIGIRVASRPRLIILALSIVCPVTIFKAKLTLLTNLTKTPEDFKPQNCQTKLKANERALDEYVLIVPYLLVSENRPLLILVKGQRNSNE